MELVVSDACDSCGKCLAVCRHKLSGIALLKCRHCAPEKAKCLLACRRNAIYEVSQGILAVDAGGKCNGCGACADACNYGAISVVDGKAVKCDLCALNDFKMPCISACGKRALKMCKSESEIDEIEKILGWRIYKIADADKRKSIAHGANYEIIETTEGLIYCIQGIPELTRQEALLLSSVLSEFQEKNEEAEPRALEESLRRYCHRNFLELEGAQHNYLLKILELLVFGFGAISELLGNGNLEEIAVIGLGKNKPVYVYERKLGWLRTNFYFCDETTLKNLVNRMSRAIGRRLSMQTPKLNAALPSGERICATISPVSVSGPSLTIRKFRKVPFTPKDLLDTGTISANALAFLQFALQTDCSMLICGNTGSGKTSTLNALFNFIPESERIIVTEETPEINLRHRHVVRLNVADGLQIRMPELIVDTLRMRPDRVIVGEIRNSEEAKAFIDTLLAGQGKGSYATFHAQSANEALIRLKSLGIDDIDLCSIDLVLVQRRWNVIGKNSGHREIRRITEIAEVQGKGNSAGLNVLYEYDYKKGRLVARNKSARVLGKIMKCHGFSNSDFTMEMKRNEKQWKNSSG